MAGTTLRNKQVHSRSISLPTRLNPNSLKDCTRNEYNQNRQAIIIFIFDSNSFRCSRVYLSLVDKACIEEFIQCPCIQQALHNQQHKNLIEKVLESSVDLLDAWSNAKELMLKKEEPVQDHQSALWRRCGDSSIESNVRAYVSQVP